MIRYKLYGILALLIFTFPNFSTSQQRETPKSLKPAPAISTLMAEAFSFNWKKKLKRKSPPIRVSASVYFPVAGQTDQTPLITADGSRINHKKPRKHRWVALSRNLLRKWGGAFDYGDSLKVEGISQELDGIYVVRDTMKKRLRNRIDILVGSNDNIMGYWDDIHIYHLN